MADRASKKGRVTARREGSRETYILRDCVAAIWSAVTVVRQLRPAVADRVFYAGGSFGGGLGALALPWDARIKRACLAVREWLA